jgi:hypothetical protein
MSALKPHHAVSVAGENGIQKCVSRSAAMNFDTFARRTTGSYTPSNMDMRVHHHHNQYHRVTTFLTYFWYSYTGKKVNTYT